MMKLAFAVLALVAVCQGLPSGFPSGRIVNGAAAKEGEIPYQVSLQTSFDGLHYCGGAVLNELYVITAAHCVEGESPDAVRVVADTIDLRQSKSVHYVEKIVIHEEFNPRKSWINDIALLKLRTPFTFSSTLSPIALPPKAEQPEVGSNAVISGWGTLWIGGPSPYELQRTDVQVADQEYCNRVNSKAGVPVYEHQICAYNTAYTTGPCHGDSGGPLTVDGKLVGITSWVISCASSIYPTVYTRVPDYIDWINANAV